MKYQKKNEKKKTKRKSQKIMRRKNFHDSIISELNKYQGKMKSPKKNEK